MPPHARPRPEHLAAKLLAIRQALKASQTEIAYRLDITAARVFEYEKGRREPNLMVLLAYSQLAGVHLELIINDNINLAKFRDALR